MSDEVKLLPCPFCEGPAEMKPLQAMRYAMCFSCGTKGSLQPSVEKAAAAWNTRQQQKASAEPTARKSE